MSDIRDLEITHKPVLPPVTPMQDAIFLEVFFIPRPAGDPLVGESLWKQLDEVTVVEPETRSRLRTAGLRVGSAGSNPPRTLRAAATDERSDSEQSSRSQRVPLLAGQPATLEVAQHEAEFSLRSTAAGGESNRVYPNGRCVLRVTGERLQEGWVRLSFRPELHHGPSLTRRTADEGGWNLQKGQAIDRLLETWFDVELHVGELVVIGASGAESDSVGATFFRSGEPPEETERILVLRVEDMQKIESVRAE